MQVQALPSGAVTVTFGPKSDDLAVDISAVVVHLYTADAKLELSSGKAPALAAVTEVLNLILVVSITWSSRQHVWLRFETAASAAFVLSQCDQHVCVSVFLKHSMAAASNDPAASAAAAAC